MKAAASVLFLLVLVSYGCTEPPTPIPQAIADDDMVEGSPEGLASMRQEVGSYEYSSSYDRQRAVWYATKYATEPNPKFAYCKSRWTSIAADCTNFVSQAIWFGGLRYDASGNDTEGWWYNGGCRKGKSSRSWRLVNDLIYYLTVESKRGRFVKIDDVQLGDLVFYKLPDNDLTCTDEFVFHHSAIVTGFGRQGTPLVSYHSNEVESIPWNWSLNESGILGLGDACSYVAVHIID